MKTFQRGPTEVYHDLQLYCRLGSSTSIAQKTVVFLGIFNFCSMGPMHSGECIHSMIVVVVFYM